MTARILLAPAASGKTAYVLGRARLAASNLHSESLILVPTSAHRYALQRRLAETGGAIGVRVETFSEFSKHSLSTTGGKYTTITTPVKHQLLRYIVNQLPLKHYTPLVGRPGFTRELARVIRELKAAKIWPEAFLGAVGDQRDEPRLRELGLVYQEYQSLLQALEWADESGWAWLAVEALRENAASITSKWSLVVVDGFDNFNEVLLAMIDTLASEAAEMIVTLTSESHVQGRKRQALELFQSTRETLETRLAVRAEPLPIQDVPVFFPIWSRAPVFQQLEQNLFADIPTRLDAGRTISLIAAPDRAGEVRAALGWLKERIVREALQPREAALLARTISPYEPFVRQVAEEYGLPIHIAGETPLRSNPAIDAILNLLELALPRAEDDPSLALPRNGVVSAWRSPYFNWSFARAEGEDSAERDGALIKQADADRLDALARSGRVIGGEDQWRELFESGTTPPLPEGEEPGERPESNATLRLARKFDIFKALISPPAGVHSHREFAEWLEGLLGPEPESVTTDGHAGATSFLQLSDSGEEELFQRDLQALLEFKELLRGMVQVERSLGQERRTTYSKFLSDLVGLIETTTYSLPGWRSSDKILVTEVVEARGLAFRAVALLGMAEGEFPKTYVEDPFIWEADRDRLNQSEGVVLESSIESYERDYFYQAVTRAQEKLLLTRPRLAESGAEWQPSPFWEEILRLVDVQPTMLTTESVTRPESACSCSELVESLVAEPDFRHGLEYIEDNEPDRLAHLHESARNFDLRFSRARTPFNGDLSEWVELFSDRFGANYRWSPSQLESYHRCPHYYFVDRVLYLKLRQEPAEGMDAGQRGSIYHRIMERVYQVLDPDQRTDSEKLLAVLPTICRQVLDEAPKKMGFRETAWWRETKQEIANNVARSIEAMAEIQGEFVPAAFEQRFSALKIMTAGGGEDQFILGGFIDRVDRDPDGRSRIIDYKTAGPFSYTKKTLENGEKIQLALYALAARDALGFGEPVDGFYWHLQHATLSELTLAGYGPAAAIDVAVEHAWNSVRGARQGYFVAHAPPDGCPEYCPAAGFCWNYRKGMWG